MNDRDTADIWTALTIGAVVGVGTALLLRARQADEDAHLLHRLRPVGRTAGRMLKQARQQAARGARAAGSTGGDLVDAGRDALEELRDGARQIVDSTRDELRKVVHDAVKDARKAGRKARRTFA
jgi:gas vesicle protein